MKKEKNTKKIIKKNTKNNNEKNKVNTKLMNKYKVYIIVFILLIGMYSGLKKAEVSNIIDRMYETQISNANIDMKYDVYVGTMINGTDLYFNSMGIADMEAVGLNSKNEFKADLKGDITCDISSLGKESFNTSGHLEINKDKMIISYLDKENNKIYEKKLGGINNNENGLDANEINEIKNQFRRVLKKARVKKKCKVIDNEECYVLKLDTSLIDFARIIEYIMKNQNKVNDTKCFSMDKLNNMHLDPKNIAGYIRIKSEIYVSKSKGCLMGGVIDFSESDIDGMLGRLGLKPEDITNGLISSGPIKLNSFKIEVTLSRINML